MIKNEFNFIKSYIIKEKYECTMDITFTHIAVPRIAIRDVLEKYNFQFLKSNDF